MKGIFKFVEWQLTLQHRLISAAFVYTYVAIVSDAEECNYHLWLTRDGTYNHAHAHLVLQGNILE